MGRHLDQAFFSEVLHRGKAIECFLGAGEPYDEEPTIRWVGIRKEDDHFVACLYEAVDPCDPEWLDVYAFQSTAEEPDEPIMEERYDDLESAIARTRVWGADPGRFVNEGMVGAEYGDYLERRSETR